MTTSTIQPLLKFISNNKLNKTGGILFNAGVSFYRDDCLQQIISQVQVIMLPHEIALYILEFLKEEINENEMYSSSCYHFKLPEATTLEIYKNAADENAVLSITLL